MTTTLTPYIYRRILSIFALVLSSLSFSNLSIAHAALPSPYELTQTAMNEGHYLKTLMLLREHKQDYLNSPFHMTYFDLLATVESFLGMDREALKDDDLAYDNPQSIKNQLTIAPYQLKNAKEIIINVSQTQQAIFINEAHHSPLHRAFTLSLLQALFDNGFRYFAVETLNEFDLDLNSRGYPLSQKTGYYTDEPMYGELIRAALKIGYKVIAYEATPDCDVWTEEDSPAKCQNLREQGQANNLYEQVFKIDPTAKLLVHAGYGHIAKKEVGDWVPMAVYFQQITGINPYSIDQTVMREHSARRYEDSVFRKTESSGLLHEVSGLLTDDNNNWLPSVYQDMYDLMIFHPRTKYQHNRPVWLLESEKRKIWPISATVCNDNYPCTIEAIFEEESLQSVPIDSIVVSSSESQPVLTLPPGKYLIRARDIDGNILSSNARSIL